jgi:hypothetical protein
MMRLALIISLGLGLQACAAAGRDGGVATYDSLRAAQAECAAKGGTLRPKTEGNFRSIDGYACEVK